MKNQGRNQSVYMARVQEKVNSWFSSGGVPSTEAALQFEIGRTTLYRWYWEWLSSGSN
jgi:hypothetical protein